jgi:hypothetical protein
MSDELRRLVTSEHQFYFKTTGLVTARSLADSLIGLEGVVLNSRGVIACLLGDGAIKEMEVLISGVTVASYKDDFIVRFCLGKGKALEKNIDALRKTLKLDRLGKMEAKHVIGIAMAGALAWVAWQAAKPDDPARIQIQNSFNTIGAEAQLSGDEMRGIIEALMSKPKQADMKRKVSQLIHPDGVVHDGSVIIDNNPNLAIPAEVVKSIPAKSADADADNPVADFEKQQMVVRAVDLDSSSKGWWAIIAEISESRLPLHLTPDVNPAKVPIGRYCDADVTVIYTVDRHGNKKPKQYILRKVHLPEDGPQAPQP